ncbi:hypothetical protein B0J11DRAFT_578520 [Dendryphion nanum]|uniref:Uncharacterized protein n=1 Tax=Dendryphion nanum TaxID=256645 RepID=A0A9P9DZI7_9PLEO|nr:hypothetical protein B0J11DRAFT_578520 [Dendryphion nanum]
MDWARDNAFLSENEEELNRIFQYGSRPTTAIKITTDSGNSPHTRIASLETDDQLQFWLHQMEPTDRSVYLILANREVSDTSYGLTCKPSTIEEWLSRTKENISSPAFKSRAAQTFENLVRKQTAPANQPKPRAKPARALPFSQDIFKIICDRFGVHRSTVRTITRQNVPSFSCEKVDMKGQAIVYNLRTPNSWPSDLALSATHYPSKAITFAIIYGTTPEIERDIVTRLQRANRSEVLHPLLIPGIIAELELRRHIRLVEKHINAIESHVISLDYSAKQFSRADAEKRIETKSEIWLNLTYLRNSISTWSGQLMKMNNHAKDLSGSVFDAVVMHSPVSISTGRTMTDTTLTGEEPVSKSRDEKSDKVVTFTEKVVRNQREEITITKRISEEADDCIYEEPHPLSTRCTNEGIYLQEMQEVGIKFQARLDAIRDEYEEKLRDCTMRLDGMAMATQWSHSETAVEIALATSQDSKVMRSISLVTMVFLPGTFFATVFSMTFFDWKSEEDQMVSSYLWIYIVVTLFFTAITLGCWYFFVIFRRSVKKQDDEESMILD